MIVMFLANGFAACAVPPRPRSPNSGADQRRHDGEQDPQQLHLLVFDAAAQ